MLLSMTGHGQARRVFPGGELEVVVQSVNRRYLDVQVRLPPELLSLEWSVRTQVSKRIHRGQVSVVVRAQFHESSPASVWVNESLARRLQEGYGRLAGALGHGEHVGSEAFLPIAQTPGVLEVGYDVSDSSHYATLLQEVVHDAIGALMHSRAEEGARLEEAFLIQLGVLRETWRALGERSGQAPERMRARLKKCLDTLFGEAVSHDERIAKEVAIYADRADVTEELERIGYQLDHFERVLGGPETAKGKKLEFVLQELLREMNTLGAKAEDALATEAVIEAKSEIEKMREQVQNVE